MTVLRPVPGPRDPMGEPSVSYEEEMVDGVLLAPSQTIDAADGGRPHAVRTAYRAAFPRWYGKSLRGCLVSVGGELFSVVGDPRPCASCPGRWWMTADLEARDG